MKLDFIRGFIVSINTMDSCHSAVTELLYIPVLTVVNSCRFAYSLESKAEAIHWLSFVTSHFYNFLLCPVCVIYLCICSLVQTFDFGVPFMCEHALFKKKWGSICGN